MNLEEHLELQICVDEENERHRSTTNRRKEKISSSKRNETIEMKRKKKRFSRLFSHRFSFRWLKHRQISID